MDVLRTFTAEWPGNQFFNLAFEEGFYSVAREPTIRFWRNDRVVIIGRFQSPVLEVNAVEALGLGVRLVRRFTGGGAVYHDLGNLNYALALPGYSLDVEEAFRLVGEAVAEALKDLGVKDAYYRPLNDIEVGGLKVSGMAAHRSHDRIFVHGAMLLSSDISVLWRVLKVSEVKLSDKRFTGSRVKRVVTVSEALGRAVSPEEVIDAILEVLARRMRLRIKQSDVGREELVKALDLYRSRYSRLEWNLAYVEELRDLLNEEEYEALKEISKPSPQQEEVLSSWMK
ncbi:MAG: biotin/lipoate A/B protein ligase family protein [Zestosphaera sp.]